MFIQIEETPNPATLKFLPGRTILEQETLEFPSIESADSCSLAQELFAIEGVSRIFIGKDFVSVTKQKASEWIILKPSVLQAMVNYFALHEKVQLLPVKDRSSAEDVDVSEDEVVKEIQDLLNNRVRPAVAMDGGDITFEKFEDGIVYLRLKGACSGCPSASATLKGGIENMLKYYIPEVSEVRAVED